MEINEKLIHFVGIGGVSMSSLACFAIMNGAYVTGSDKNSIPMKAYLDNIGIKSYLGSSPDIARNADLLVYTSAIGEDDIELISALDYGVPVMPRHQFLSIIANYYQDVIAISGTHGKTTTTAMLSAIFMHADYPYAAHIGGNSLDIGGNYYHKGNMLFITEACEYKKSFLSLNPSLAIILNIDPDHPDTYRTEEELYDAFEQFNNSADMTLAFYQYKNICKDKHIITFGADRGADYYIANMRAYQYDNYCFDIYTDEQLLIQDIELPLPGKHNVMNALCAATAAITWGIEPEVIRYALNNYKGVSRRFEIKGKFNNALVISDYAHHPREITAVISSARAMADNKLIVAFEPHTYSRTNALINDFLNCFTGVDKLIILPTYAARELSSSGMDSAQLIEKLNSLNVISAMDYYDARRLALLDAGEGDVVLVVGAGSIEKLADIMCEASAQDI